MLLDYRCFIKTSDPSLLQKGLKQIEMEAVDGSVFALTEIAELFADPNQMMRMLEEPIGDVFDTVACDNEVGFCFIHDHKKSFAFFEGLTSYIFEQMLATIGDNFVMVADVTNYDDDSFGNAIFYYLGADQKISTLHIDGPEGLIMHDENEISELIKILKSHNISQKEKDVADKYYVELEDLMNYNLSFMMNGMFDDEEEFEEEED